jgi:hypothetical protein
MTQEETERAGHRQPRGTGVRLPNSISKAASSSSRLLAATPILPSATRKSTRSRSESLAAWPLLRRPRS